MHTWADCYRTEAAVPRRPPKPLPTIWRVPDDLWRLVERVLTELDPPKQMGRKRIDPGVPTFFKGKPPLRTLTAVQLTVRT